MRAVHDIFFGLESAPEDWRNSHQFKIICGDVASGNKRRITIAGERHARVAVASHSGEDGIQPFPILKIRPGNAGGVAVGTFFGDPNELIGSVVRQRAKKDGVGESEHRCICADAESEC